MNAHRRLVAWQACRALIAGVYRATAGFPAAEKFGLVSQLRRAAVSSAANIAEGFGRTGVRETARGLSISLGSLAEIDALFAASEDLGYLKGAELKQLEQLLDTAGKLTYGLHRKVRARASE